MNAEAPPLLRLQALFTPNARYFRRRHGAFGAMAAWHPQVRGCEVRGRTRTLSLTTGQTVRDRRTGRGGTEFVRTLADDVAVRIHLGAFDDEPGLAVLDWAVYAHQGTPSDAELVALREFLRVGMEAIGGERIIEW